MKPCNVLHLYVLEYITCYPQSAFTHNLGMTKITILVSQTSYRNTPPSPTKEILDSKQRVPIQLQQRLNYVPIQLHVNEPGKYQKRFGQIMSGWVLLNPLITGDRIEENFCLKLRSGVLRKTHWNTQIALFCMHKMYPVGKILVSLHFHMLMTQV